MNHQKPILVGEYNPYGSDPYYALYPMPQGCAGERLCCDILGMYKKDYLEVFDRTNLCAGSWSITKAREKAESLRGRYAVLLGSKVCAAYDVPFEPFASQYPGTPEGGGGILVLPHPSGRNRMWSDPDNLKRARDAMVAFLPQIVPLVGRFDK